MVMCHTKELAFKISKEYERFLKFVAGIKPMGAYFDNVDEVPLKEKRDKIKNVQKEQDSVEDILKGLGLVESSAALHIADDPPRNPVIDNIRDYGSKGCHERQQLQVQEFANATIFYCYLIVPYFRFCVS